jgi:ABC-type uncharacterized transport system auxiliary subunit
VAVKAASFLPLLLAVNCVRVNVGSDSPTTIIHKLDYDVPLSGEKAYQNAVRVIDFSATTEYDRQSLVLVLANGTVQRTGFHQWAAKPALALADLLHRDLLAEGAFPVVHRRGAVEGGELVVEGFLREFGARETEGMWLAVLDVDLLMHHVASPEEDKQMTYRLTEALPRKGYIILAQTLSELVEEWSQAVRSDIRGFADDASGR